MARVFSALFWTVVFLLILLVGDQLLVRVPARHPVHSAVATFYRDLRSRAILLVKGRTAPPPTATAPATATAPDKARTKPGPDSIETLITRRPTATAPVGKTPAPVAQPVRRQPLATEPAPRYVYADRQGDLHFADTLAEVPEEYRAKAKPLGE